MQEDPSPACLAHTKAAVKVKEEELPVQHYTLPKPWQSSYAQRNNPWILIAYGTVLETCHSGPQPYDKSKETKS